MPKLKVAKKRPGRPPKGEVSIDDQILAAMAAGCETTREIGEFIGGKPPRSLSPHMNRLEKQGRIERVGSVIYEGSKQHGWRWKLVKPDINAQKTRP